MLTTHLSIVDPYKFILLPILQYNPEESFIIISLHENNYILFEFIILTYLHLYKLILFASKGTLPFVSTILTLFHLTSAFMLVYSFINNY